MNSIDGDDRRTVVMFVDDDPGVTAALKRVLRHEPYEVIEETSADGALRVLGARPVDVVFSDEQMPGMSGSAFLAEVRRRFPRTIRMILSGQATLEAAVRAINEGRVYRFFLKPCHPSDVKAAIRQSLEQRQLADLSRQLLQRHQKQAQQLRALEHHSPGITQLHTDADGAIIVEETDADCDPRELLQALSKALDT
jgi:DNA-binding NtrC family response regulator